MTRIDQLVAKVRRIPPIGVDSALAGAVVVAALPEALSSAAPQRPLAVLSLAVCSLSVALRRANVWLGCTLLLVIGVMGLGAHAQYTEGTAVYLAGLVLLYTVSERSSLAAPIAVTGWVVAYFVLQRGHWNNPEHLLYYGFVYLPWIGVAWFAGRAQRRSRTFASQLERSSLELRHEQELLAQNAVTLERTRVAGELRELVQWGVERMKQSAHVARALLASDPEAAALAVGAIETDGRRTLVQMRRLLAILRAQEADVARSNDDPPNRVRRRRTPAVPRLADGTRAEPQPGSSDRRGRVRRRAPTPRVTDLGAVLALAIMAIAEAVVQRRYTWAGIHTARDVAFLAVILGTLLFRQRAPLVVLCVAAAVTCVWYQYPRGGAWTGDMALVVAAYTVGAVRGIGWGIAAIGAVELAYAGIRIGYWQVGWSLQFGLAVMAGIAVRSSRRWSEELIHQTDLLRRTRGKRVRLAVDHERTRIARDVHDMVAHGVTLMVIQAGAARWLVLNDPSKAQQALSVVELAGRQALVELDDLVGSLKGRSSEGIGSSPASEAVSIRSLVEGEVRTGAQVELVTDGEPQDLDSGLELSVYRIVQEALTNVRKHARGATVHVKLTYARDGVAVEVTDSGIRNRGAAASPVPGSGHGLLGIGERAALFGGHAEAGPTPEGGFRIRAVLKHELVSA